MTVNSILIIFIIFVVKFSLAEVESMAELEDLGESLKYTYHKDVVPLHNENHPVTVAVGFRLDSIQVILDEGLRDIEVTGWLTLSWKDSRLRWNPKKHVGIDVLRMDVKNIWKPNISPDNGTVDSQTENAWIYPTGKVVWIPRSNLNASCTHKPTYYPYDTLDCSLKFGSRLCNGRHLDFELYENTAEVDLSYMSVNEDWKVVSTSAKKTTKKYECCEEPHPAVTFLLKLKREPSMPHGAILHLFYFALIVALTAFCYPPFIKTRLFINAFIVIMLLLCLSLIQEMFPIYARNSTALVLICETMILMCALAMVWNYGLMSVNRGHLCNCRPPRWVQWLSHLCMKRKCFKKRLDEWHYYNNVIDIASEDKNVWMAFFLFLDYLLCLLFYSVLLSLMFMFVFETFA